MVCLKRPKTYDHVNRSALRRKVQSVLQQVVQHLSQAALISHNHILTGFRRAWDIDQTQIEAEHILRTGCYTLLNGGHSLARKVGHIGGSTLDTNGPYL